MRYLLLFLAVFGAVALHAQNGHSESSQHWQALQELQIPALAKKPARTSPKSAQEKAQERQELVAHYSTLAAAAKAYRQSYPGDAKVKESLVIEVNSLLKMALLGDDAQTAYRDSLVSEIRRDGAIPSPVRYNIVALSEHLRWRKTFRTPIEARSEKESIARLLIKEFPSEEGGYLSLLNAVHANGDPAKIRSAAQEIEDSPAPFAAKGAAQVVANRYSLIGKSLADVANTALGRDNFFEMTRNRRTVLYSWATWSPGSVDFAKNVLGKIKGDVVVIGFNLDRDVEKAREVARKEKLPGTHYYDSAGPGSLLTLLFSLNGAPLVYLTDQNGVITDVSAHRRDLPGTLKQGAN